MDALLQDIRFAARMLAKRPGFTLIAVASLALGIGANATVFSMVNAFLLRPMPYEQPDELVHVWGVSRTGTSRVSVPNYLDWRAQASSFADMAAFNYTIETLTGGEFPEQISGGRVSANAFEMLGVAPMLGRGFAPGEDTVDGQTVAILSASTWRERFGGRRDVIGETLEVEGRAHTIIGIMPEGVNFPLPNTEIWFPRALDAPRFTRDAGMLQIAARLAPGVTAEQAQAELQQVTARLEAEYPDANDDLRATIVPLRSALNFADDIMRPMSALLLVAVGFVLLIACANIANLLLARASARQREICVRASLGAGRGRLMRQMLTESAMIAGLGAIAGLIFAVGGIRALDGAMPGELYRVGALEVDAAVIAYSLGLAAVTALIFGIVPALRSTRFDLSEGLRQGSGGGTAASTTAWQGLMVGVEMTLAIVLLVGTALMIRSLANMQRADTGFTSSGVATMRMLLPSGRYGDDVAVAAFHRDLSERARSVPGVIDASTVNYLPLNHETAGAEFTIVGQTPPPAPYESVSFTVGPGYFRVLDIPVLAGRAFGEQDDADAPRVVVVDQTTADRFWPGGDPIGERLEMPGSGNQYEIIGVVGAAKQVDLATAPSTIYIAQQQVPWRYMRLLARTAGDPMATIPALRAAVAELDPLLPLSEIRTMDKVVEDFLLPQRMLVTALGVVGGGAMLLAAIGVYGLMSFYVAQRLRDIGIRIALGATRNQVRRMIATRVLRLAGKAVLIGVVVAIGLTQLMSSMLYGVSPADTLTFAATAAFLVAVALVAGLLGARQATRLDPVEALRSE